MPKLFNSDIVCLSRLLNTAHISEPKRSLLNNKNTKCDLQYILKKSVNTIRIKKIMLYFNVPRAYQSKIKATLVNVWEGN